MRTGLPRPHHLARLTKVRGIGVDRVIDALGVDAQRPKSAPAAEAAQQQVEQFEQERSQVAPEQDPHGDTWVPGNAPSQSLQWAVEAVAKAGSIGIIGVYRPQLTSLPTGAAMNKNLTVQMGNCNHRRYIPHPLDLVRTARSTRPRCSRRSVTCPRSSTPTRPSTSGRPAGPRSPSTRPDRRSSSHDDERRPRVRFRDRRRGDPLPR
jgi:threonine dehydrogenase-like Zn-dependent dehydrogenase